MNGLASKRVFISASLPSGPRGEEVRPYDAPAIIDAVAAISRMVLRSGGGLVSGGHPTITPVMLTVGEQVGVRGAVDVFQSRWFEDCISEDTTELANSGVGFVHFVDKEETMEESLAAMRPEILKTCPVAAVFVGGMDGIFKEHEMVGQLLPDIPRIPIKGPGGAAARLPTNDADVPPGIAALLHSRQYPFLASVLVQELERRCAGDSRVSRLRDRERCGSQGDRPLLAD